MKKVLGVLIVLGILSIASAVACADGPWMNPGTDTNAIAITGSGVSR